MKKIIVLALAFSVFFGVASAHAEDEFDVLEFVCEETFADEELYQYFSVWMVGYLGAKTNEPMYSSEILSALKDQTGRMCQERPQATLGEILNHLLQ